MADGPDKPDKGKMLEEAGVKIDEGEEYSIAGGDVVSIVSGLLQLVLAFMPPAQAKYYIDRVWAQRVNDDAEAFEKVKFSPKN
jgi:hypothetical protein